MRTIQHSIDVRHATNATHVSTWPIIEVYRGCGGERRRGCSMPRQWWQEQAMDLDFADAAAGLNE
jgi:hypothetical protein